MHAPLPLGLEVEICARITRFRERQGNLTEQGSIPTKSVTRSGPKIPAVGLLGGGFLFGLDKFGHLMANMSYLPNFRSLEPPHGLEEAPVVH